MNRVRLGNVCTKIGSGATPRGGQEVYCASGTTLIRSQNVYNDRFAYDGLVYIDQSHADQLAGVTVQPEDILLNITGDSVARVCQVPAHVLPARVNQHVAIIRPNQEVLDARYLRYFLVSPVMQQRMLALAAAGATRNALTKGMIEDFEILCPPLAEQRAIAAVLGTLDDKIELNRRINQTLEQIAQAVFTSWFVDFDPVHANRSGEAMPGLAQAVQALFPYAFQESALGEIPQGWRVGSVGDVGEIICGKTPPTNDAENYGKDVPFVTIPDMHQKVFVTETARYLSLKGAQTQSNKMLPAFSICVSCIATPGLVAMTSQRSQTNQQINTVVPRTQATTYYSYFALRGLADEIKAHGSGGSVVHNLNKAQFSALPILLVPDGLAERFQQAIDPLFQQLLLKEQETRTLAATRDALLPKLLSGEVRVREVEKIVEDVL